MQWFWPFDTTNTIQLHLLDFNKKLEVQRYEVKIEGVIPKSEGPHVIVDITASSPSE